MTNPHDTYTSPLASRNASPEMLRIWSPRHKFTTWRRIWLAVAEAQQACGLDITDEQIAELRAHVEVTDEDMERAAGYEKDLRHDVMAHVHAYGDVAPKAKAIIHLGCTSQDVVCNADLLLIYSAHKLIVQKVTRVVIAMSRTAEAHLRLPTLGFTHYQPAQPTTLGRRLAEQACALHHVYSERLEVKYNDWQMFRGFRGATGTQASFLALFDNDASRVDEFEARAIWNLLDTPRTEADFEEWRNQVLRDHRRLLEGRQSEGDTTQIKQAEQRVARLEQCTYEAYLKSQIEMTISHRTFGLTGQTYPRVVDTLYLADLASIAAVLHKIATDIRLLSNRKELDEPFGDKQIGSSAMPYKRNPMKCERICGLTRFVMNLVGNAYDTAATQWLERTLDDSSNRRLSLPESFLALDGALDLMHQVASGLVVHEAMVKRNLMAELPFLATENILMECVKAGADRQEYHEIIRVHAQAAGMRVKDEGLDNDLLDRLNGDPAFHTPALKHELDWGGLMDPMKYVGRAVEQTERFLKEVVEPLRERYADELEALGDSDRGV